MNTRKVNLFYKKTVENVKELSSCARLHVGSMIVKDSRIISTGYNGSAPGAINCDNIFLRIANKYVINMTLLTTVLPDIVINNEDALENTVEAGNSMITVPYDVWQKTHHEFSEVAEIHAEMNAICYAVKNNQNINGAEIIVSTAPCINCAKMIVASGIKTVKFVDEYDRSSLGYKFLVDNGIHIQKI